MGLDSILMDGGLGGVAGGSPPSMLHFHQQSAHAQQQHHALLGGMGRNTSTDNLFSDVSQLYGLSDGGAGGVNGVNMLFDPISGQGGASMGMGRGAAGEMMKAAGGGGAPGSSSSASSSGHLPAAPPSMMPTPAMIPVPDTWEPHPLDPLRFVKYEIRQLLLSRGSLSIAQLPEVGVFCTS
jgi:hypothetical protein